MQCGIRTVRHTNFSRKIKRQLCCWCCLSILHTLRCSHHQLVRTARSKLPARSSRVLRGFSARLFGPFGPAGPFRLKNRDAPRHADLEKTKEVLRASLKDPRAQIRKKTFQNLAHLCCRAVYYLGTLLNKTLQFELNRFTFCYGVA